MIFDDVFPNNLMEINTFVERFWVNLELLQAEAALKVWVREELWNRERDLSRFPKHFHKVYHRDE